MLSRPPRCMLLVTGIFPQHDEIGPLQFSGSLTVTIITLTLTVSGK